MFVCYAHDDERLVYPEIRWLDGAGVRIWYDEGVSPGAEWTEELGRAIDDADRFLYFVTPASVASRHCRNEVHFAQSRGKPILVVHLCETELPKGLELVVGSSQALFRSEMTEEAYRAKLRTALAEEVRTKFTGYRETRVVVPDASAASAQLASSYVIRGTGGADGATRRVRAHLERTTDGQTVWSKAFDVSEGEASTGVVPLADDVARHLRLQLVMDHECETVRQRSARREAADYFCAAFAEDLRVNLGGESDGEVVLWNAERAVRSIRRWSNLTDS